MGDLFGKVGEYLSWVVESVYGWLFLLNHEEWMLLLAIVASLGFLCMRGFGTQKN